MTAEIATTFRRLYLAWGLPLCLMCLLPLAWHWSVPGPYDEGVGFVQAAGALLAAVLPVNLLSFWLQRRYLRAQLLRGTPLRAGPFALRFYLINLGVAIALTALLWQPLLMLLFSYRLYPVALWWMPYHAPLGWRLGRWLEGQTTEPAAPATRSR